MLKGRRISVELVTEYVKSWACQKRPVTSFDQVYLLGKQMQYEYRFLNSGTKNIVTDSPVLLSAIYAEIYYAKLNIAKPIMDLVDAYEAQYPSLNIFLRRRNKPYSQEGRYQDYEQAKAVDALILESLADKAAKGWTVKYFDWDDCTAVLEYVSEQIAL